MDEAALGSKDDNAVPPSKPYYLPVGARRLPASRRKAPDLTKLTRSMLVGSADYRRLLW